MYEYVSYDEIPENVASFVVTVGGLSELTDITVEEINTFLNELNEYYERCNQSLEDFIDG